MLGFHLFGRGNYGIRYLCVNYLHLLEEGHREAQITPASIHDDIMDGFFRVRDFNGGEQHLEIENTR